MCYSSTLPLSVSFSIWFRVASAATIKLKKEKRGLVHGKTLKSMPFLDNVDKPSIPSQLVFDQAGFLVVSSTVELILPT